MPSCFISTCSSTDRKKEKDVTFHRFPIKDRDKWIAALKVNSPETVHPQSVLCSLHFQNSDFLFYKFCRRLKEGAIPSLNLRKRQNYSFQNVSSSSSSIMNNHKYCVVPMCKNTLIMSPNKIFVRVPNDPKKRNLWLEKARRNPSDLSAKSTIYMCEDHFTLEEDMENYMEYKMMGVNKRMKPDAVPRKFDCQSPLGLIDFTEIIAASYKRPRVTEETLPKTVPIKPIEFVNVQITSAEKITPQIPEDIKDISFFLKLYVKQETLCLTENWGIFPGENKNMKHILFSQMTVKNNIPTMEKQIILYSNLEIKFFFGTNQINHVTTSVISKEELEKTINSFSDVNLPQMYEHVTNHVDRVDIKNEPFC